MSEESQILVKQHRNPAYLRVIEKLEYTWRGGPVARVTNDTLEMLDIHHLPHIGDRFDFGPFRLRVVDVPFYQVSDSVLVMRDGWRARVRYLLRRATLSTQRFKCRLILTAAIWNLGERREGEVIRWRQIYAINWLVKRFGGKA